MPPMNTKTPQFRLVRAAYMRRYGGRCILHPTHRAVALHEEPPRSLNPLWGEQPETWYPLCAKCHEQVHDMTHGKAKRLLGRAKAEFPEQFITNSFLALDK